MQTPPDIGVRPHVMLMRVTFFFLGKGARPGVVVSRLTM